MVNRTWKDAIIDIAWNWFKTKVVFPRTEYEFHYANFLKREGVLISSGMSSPENTFDLREKRKFRERFERWFGENERPQLEECPACGGGGKETCDNPDHGFISALTWHDKGRLGCPCCGHDPNHKVINGGKCETCDGSGVATKSFADKWFKENEVKR